MSLRVPVRLLALTLLALLCWCAPSAHAGEDEGADYLTPKNGTEGDVNALVGAMSRSSDDEPGKGLEPCKEEAVLDGAELGDAAGDGVHAHTVGHQRTGADV